MDLLGLTRLHTGRKLRIRSCCHLQPECRAWGMRMHRDEGPTCMQWHCSTGAATPRKYKYACSKHEGTNLKMAQASHGGGLSSGTAAFAAALQVQHAGSQEAGGNECDRSCDVKDEMQEEQSIAHMLL
jgi:hypothetical protein